MKVFISWSGETSRQIAEALREWLPLIMHDVDLFMSKRDTDAGTRWQQVISNHLNASDYGVLIMTPDNLQSRWLLFEAGALSKDVAEANVVPLLYNLKTADVEMPLAQFQMKELQKQGVLELLQGINKSNARPLDGHVLQVLFDSLWPDLEKRIEAVGGTRNVTAPRRSERDLLEEILDRLRGRDSTASLILEEKQTALVRLINQTLGASSSNLIRQSGGQLELRVRDEPKKEALKTIEKACGEFEVALDVYVGEENEPRYFYPPF